MTEEGLPAPSFRTLRAVLGPRCRKVCRIAGAGNGAAFEQLTELRPVQARAFQLLGA